jgi:Phage integrase, N-terminal SAM-like domain
MIKNYFKRAFARRRMATSHLRIIFDTFVSDLHRRGHSRNSIQFYVQAAEHFGRWLQRRRVAVSAIQEGHVNQFLSRHLPHCRCPMPAARTLKTCRAALSRLMDTLHGHGFIPSLKPKSVRLNARDRLLEQFDHHLDAVCGLSTSTRRARQRYAGQFLSWRFKRGSLCLRALKPKDLLVFIQECARTWTRGGLHDLTVGLRSFLRFLQFSGQIRIDLCQAVPRLPSPRISRPRS